MIEIKLWHEPNTLCVNVYRVNGIITYQHIGLNMSFINQSLFINALSHEYIHVALNDIDKSGNLSCMYDNIDSYKNNYRCTVLKETLRDKIVKVIKCY